MPSGNRDLDIAKNVKMIEWLKSELLSSLSNLYKAMIVNAEDRILDALASVVLGCYFLGRRLGFSYEKLDHLIDDKLQSAPLEDHELEEWYGEVSGLKQYREMQNHKEAGVIE